MTPQINTACIAPPRAPRHVQFHTTMEKLRAGALVPHSEDEDEMLPSYDTMDLEARHMSYVPLDDMPASFSQHSPGAGKGIPWTEIYPPVSGWLTVQSATCRRRLDGCVNMKKLRDPRVIVGSWMVMSFILGFTFWLITR